MNDVPAELTARISERLWHVAEKQAGRPLTEREKTLLFEGFAADGTEGAIDAIDSFLDLDTDEGRRAYMSERTGNGDYYSSTEQEQTSRNGDSGGDA